MKLNLIFGNINQYKKAKEFFAGQSSYYAEDDDYSRMLSFEVQNQADADSTEHYIDQELQGKTDIQGYYWEIDDSEDDYYSQNESKKAKVKTLIERIVEKVIAKKFLKESIKPKRRLKENSDFIDLQDFENHIHDNIDDIFDNMKTYGFTLKKIRNIRNYYDLSSLTDIDSNQLRDVEIAMYANTAYDLIKQYMDDL